MDEFAVFDVILNALWVSVVMSTPILTVALLVGLGIGLLQALTSVQEMTLTFVPKVAAILVTFWITISTMSGSLVAFFNDQILTLIATI